MLMSEAREKLSTIPSDYSVAKRGEQFGLYKAGPTVGDGEWLVSADRTQLDVLPGLLQIFFEKSLVAIIFQEILRLARE